MIDDPGVNRRSLAKRAKNAVSHEDAIVRREHLESLRTQGQMMRANSDAPDICSA